MACACEKSGAPRCAHCKEAVVNGFKNHHCSYFGTCD